MVFNNSTLFSGENAMLDSNMGIKVIDFGRAKDVHNPMTGFEFRDFQDDVLNAVRIFSGCYAGQYFNTVHDMKRNWKHGIQEVWFLSYL